VANIVFICDLFNIAKTFKYKDKYANKYLRH